MTDQYNVAIVMQNNDNKHYITNYTDSKWTLIIVLCL